MDKVGKSSQPVVPSIDSNFGGFAGAKPTGQQGTSAKPRYVASAEERGAAGLNFIAQLGDLAPVASHKDFETPIMRVVGETFKVAGELADTPQGHAASKALGVFQAFIETTEVAQELQADIKNNDRTYSRTMKSVVAKTSEALFYGAVGVGGGAIAGLIAGFSAPAFVTAGAAVVTAGALDHLGVCPDLMKIVRDRSQEFANGLIDSVSPQNVRSTISSITDGAAGALRQEISLF